MKKHMSCSKPGSITQDCPLKLVRSSSFYISSPGGGQAVSVQHSSTTATSRRQAMTQQQRFLDKVALVTGGAVGIGRAVSMRLAQEGAKVLLLDVDDAAGASVVEEIHEAGLTAQYIAADVSVEAQVQGAVAQVLQLWGRLDVLVNNAARFVFAHTLEVTEAQMDAALATNVKGYTWCMKHGIAAMLNNCSVDAEGPAESRGAVVNLASISSFRAQEGFLPYSATKGAIAQLTRVAALDVGKHGIRVNAVCPGPILTRGTQLHAESQGKSVEEAVAKMSSHMIIQRMGRPEEVAAAVAFLASDEASFITGACLMVDGGYSVL